MADDKVILKLDGTKIVETTIDAIKEMIKPLKLKNGSFEWNAYFAVN